MKEFVKSIMAALFVCCLASSCVNSVPDSEEDEELKEVTFNVGFRTDIEEMSRTTSGEQLPNVISGLELYDCAVGKEPIHISQKSADDNFGKISLSIPKGSHDFYFIGHNSDVCTFDTGKGECSFDRVKDTFSFYTSLVVDDNTESLQTITLSRQIAQLKIILNDAIPQGAKKMRITVSDYAPTLNVKSGIGTGITELEREWDYSDSNIGQKGTSYSIYSFVPKEEHTVTIKVSVLDADNNAIEERTISDIPVKKNRLTKIHGDFFSVEMGSSIVIETTWDEEIEIPFP